MSLTLILLTAVALDFVLGEPSNTYHPLVAFGNWASRVENLFLQNQLSAHAAKIAGAMAVIIVLSPFLGALFWLLETNVFQAQIPQAIAASCVLYFCIAPRSLQQHADAVQQALQQADLVLARQQIAKIVSRDTQSMSVLDVRRAAIESVLENAADALFAPIFWFVVAGPLAVVLYRLVNTLDAMWGYKNLRYQHFGWAAARFDDILNYVPARITALTYALLGNRAQAFSAWHEHAPLLESPNAGPVMAAGGGSLDLKLGGPASYHGNIKLKPWFGGKQDPENHDIQRAYRLMYKTLALWLILIAVGDSLA